MKSGLLVLAFALALRGQPSAFEVASVKLAAPGGRMVRSHGGPGTDSPTRWTCTNCNLTQVITEAWDLRYFQLSGPAWLADQRFDISATLPEGTGKDQFRLMKKALLEERFGLKAHLEARETQVYDLVVARGGSKLSPTTTPERAPAAGPVSSRPPPSIKTAFPKSRLASAWSSAMA